MAHTNQATQKMQIAATMVNIIFISVLFRSLDDLYVLATILVVIIAKHCFITTLADHQVYPVAEHVSFLNDVHN